MKYFLLFILAAIPVFAYTETEVVAAVIVMEAGGEGRIGMQAVANVINNRITSKKNAFQVVTQKYQFSPVIPYANDLQALVNKAGKHGRWNEALYLAENLSGLSDVTGGATHFHSGAKPWWADKLIFKKKIGGHYFYQEKR